MCNLLNFTLYRQVRQKNNNKTGTEQKKLKAMSSLLIAACFCPVTIKLTELVAGFARQYTVGGTSGEIETQK